MELTTFQTRVAQRLSILAVGQVLPADDAVLIQGAYESLVHELGEHGLSWWNADEAVPDEFADPLVGMTAANLVDDFTIPEPRRTQLIVAGAFGLPQASIAERRLRALARAAKVDEPTEIDFY